MPDVNVVRASRAHSSLRFSCVLLIALSSFLLTVCKASSAQSAPIANISDPQLVQGLRETLAKLVAEDKFSGAVLLAKNNAILLERAYGYADHAFNVKNDINTKFNMGSMGKMFTGVAILQLAQAGKLSLDDKLVKYLPNYPNKAVANSVTIRELLTHTSGLGDFFGPEFAAANMSRFESLESLLPLFGDKPLLFEPGSKWSYSNAGYIVLGLVIQQVATESYYDYVKQHIFDPAGMHDTGNWPADADVPDRALGYTTMGSTGTVRKSNIFLLQRGGSAGGGYSTVDDLLRFAEALQNRKLLNEQFTAMEMTGQVPTGIPGVKYGFGMEERMVDGTRIVGHGGGGPGIESVLEMYPTLGYVVAIMTNYDQAMSPVNNRLRAALSGQVIPQAIAATQQSMEEFAGHYTPELPAGAQMTPPPITVTIEANGLRIDPGMGPAFHFVLVANDEFVDADTHTLHVAFLRDSGAHVIGLKTVTGFGPVPPITATKIDK
jgi:CubicO group peptidase (beta-lactamase class C family)